MEADGGSAVTERADGWRKDQKRATDVHEVRRQREDENVQIRKQKRDEILKAKRVMTSADAGTGQIDVLDIPPVLLYPGLVQELTARLLSPTTERVEAISVIRTIRTLLSSDTDTPLQEVIDCGLLPPLIQLLSKQDDPQLQFDAAWAITNVASGDSMYTMAVVDAGALPPFIALLDSEHEEIREQAMWAVGNICGDGAVLRDRVLQAGALAPLIKVLLATNKPCVVRNGTWVLANFCRNKPGAPLEWIAPALEVLAMVLNKESSQQVLTDCCWAFCFVTDSPMSNAERVDKVIQLNVIPRLVSLVVSATSTPRVVTPALRVLGNIVTGTPEQSEAVIGYADAMPALRQCLSHAKPLIRREAMWAVSNTLASKAEIVDRVLQGGMMAAMVVCLDDSSFDVQKETVWAMANIIACGRIEHCHQLVQCNGLHAMVPLLEVNDPRILEILLDTISSILYYGDYMMQHQNLAENPYTKIVESCDGLRRLEDLEVDQDANLFPRAMDILTKYFPGRNGAEGMDGDMGSEQASSGGGGGFNFA